MFKVTIDDDQAQWVPGNGRFERASDEQVATADRPNEPTFPPEILDLLLQGYSNIEDITGPDGLVTRLTVALLDRATRTGMTHHLGSGGGQRRPFAEPRPIAMRVRRNGQSTFESQVMPEHYGLFNGFDDKILDMYAVGMGVAEIYAHFVEIYGVSVDAKLISRVTGSVADELVTWQRRPLAALYLVVYLDKLVVKIRDAGLLRLKTVFVAVGVGVDGTKDVLGTWIQEIEGSKFWLSVLNDLRHRGLKDVLIVCAERRVEVAHGLAAVFPNSVFQTCIMHMVRSSVRYIRCKERKDAGADLRPLYTAETREAAEQALEEFDRRWGAQYPAIASRWREQWAEVLPFLHLPPDIRKAIYMTKPIDALHRRLRRVSKAAGEMPSNEAALTVLFIAIRKAKRVWGQPFPLWHRCAGQFAIHFADRFAQRALST
jgi:putative transposase